jgi:hypothetical protein
MVETVTLLAASTVAFSVVGGLGLDTFRYSIPCLTPWSDDDEELERLRPARR